MTSKVRDNSSRYRDGCLSENCTMAIGNLFRKLASILNKSNLNNISLTKSTSCNNESNLNDTPQIKSTGSDNEPNLKNQPKKCTRCGREKLHDEWCKPCECDYFKSNFHKWTSGNETIDNFIRGTQFSATTKFNFLEWIPFSSLTEIKFIARGGFGEVFSAIWIEGPRTKWNDEKNDWERYSNVKVALKRFLDINKKDFTQVLFKELEFHLMSNNQVVGRFNVLRTYGITCDPKSKDYMMVMVLADYGDLSAYLQTHFSKLTYVKTLEILFDIAIGLTQIHKSGLVHRDLHCGNVMCQGRGENFRFVIGDLGHAIRPKNDRVNKVIGVLPYIAPEVLIKKPYTQAVDIYSFGILMWEILTGLKAFGETAHNNSLMANIYSGLRPDIPPNTPKLYADLMQRCWCDDFTKRPSAYELYITIGTWLNQCLFVPNSEIAKEFSKIEELRQKLPQQVLHPDYVSFSTTHDITELLQSQSQKYELPEGSTNLEIPDFVNNEN